MRTLLRWLLWYPLLLALIAITLAQFWFLVHIWHWAGHNPETSAFMRTPSTTRSGKPDERTYKHMDDTANCGRKDRWPVRP